MGMKSCTLSVCFAHARRCQAGLIRWLCSATAVRDGDGYTQQQPLRRFACGVLQMACFIDHNWWKPRDGRSSAYPKTRLTDFPLPFACPLDFLFEPTYLDFDFHGKRLPPKVM